MELTIIKIDDTHKMGEVVTSIAPGETVHVMGAGRNSKKLKKSNFFFSEVYDKIARKKATH